MGIASECSIGIRADITVSRMTPCKALAMTTTNRNFVQSKVSDWKGIEGVVVVFVRCRSAGLLIPLSLFPKILIFCLRYQVPLKNAQERNKEMFLVDPSPAGQIKICGKGEFRGYRS